MAWQDYTQVTVGVKTAGKFDVGSDVLSYLGRTTDLTLTSAVFFKTVVVENTLSTPIDVNLPDATTIPGGVVAVNVLGFYSIGGPVNLRDASGNLLARFNGSKHSKTTTRPDQEIGARFDLLSVATAAGVWRPRNFYGTNFAPRIKTVETTAAAAWTMVASTGTVFPYNNISTNLASLNLPKNDGASISLDSERKLLLWADSGGTKARILKVDATTKAVTYGSISTINAFATSGRIPQVGCVYNVTGGSEYCTVVAETATNVMKIFGVQITGTSITAVGSAVTIPTTDNATQSVDLTNGSDYMQFIPLSTTKIFFAVRMWQTSGSAHRCIRFAHITASGTTLSIGTLQALGNTTIASNDGATGARRAFLVPNTADRIFFPDGGILNSATTEAMVIDTSGTNPALAYEPAAFSLPCGQMSGSTSVHYDYTDGWIYVNGVRRATELWRFKAGASAISNMEFVRDVPNSNGIMIGGNVALTGYEIPHAGNNRVSMSAAFTFLNFDIDYGGVLAGVVADNTNNPGPGNVLMEERAFQMYDGRLYGSQAYSANGVLDPTFVPYDRGTTHYGRSEHPGKALGITGRNETTLFGLMRMTDTTAFPVVIHRVLDGQSGDPGQGADVVTIVYECPKF